MRRNERGLDSDAKHNMGKNALTRYIRVVQKMPTHLQ